MTLLDWDVGTGMHLQFIRDGAEMCLRHTEQILLRPAFETLAEADLEQLETTLLEALRTTIRARAKLEGKPRGE